MEWDFFLFDMKWLYDLHIWNGMAVHHKGGDGLKDIPNNLFKKDIINNNNSESKFVIFIIFILIKIVMCIFLFALM